METVSIKRINFQKSLNALQRSIQVYNRKKDNVPEDEFAVIVAGVIQHFEMAFETSWKYLKEVLEQKHDVQVASPKAVFQDCYKYKLLPENVTDKLIVLVNDRNRTSHVYDQSMAEAVCNSILHHYEVLGQVLELVKIEN